MLRALKKGQAALWQYQDGIAGEVASSSAPLAWGRQAS
jgi:hypothetical protein